MPTISESQFHETIIVGGGMSGIGCARRLMEAGKPFLMITPEIGGRVRKSPDGTVNYGAYYVTADYRQTLPFVDLVEQVRLTDGWFQNGTDRYSLLSPRTLKHLPALTRFLSDLRTFRRHFNLMNESASDYSRRTLIEADPLLCRTYNQSASDYLQQRGLERLFEDFIDPLLWASFFVDPRQVSTFFVLAASLPMIVPMYSFVFRNDKAISGFEDAILYDTVADIVRDGDNHVVRTHAGRIFTCRNLVLATPIDHSNRLLGESAQPIRQGVDVSFVHLRGQLKKQYQGRSRNFFSLAEAAVISREVDGSYLYFYEQENISRYFESYSVITQDRWHPALYFIGNQLIRTNPVPGVYIASDHDVPSIENAYLNGRYAAKLLLRESGASAGDAAHGNYIDSMSFSTANF
jgi:hypothetical protein